VKRELVISPREKRLFKWLLFILLISVVLVFLPNRLPDWMELRIERLQLWRRVQNGGGWAALQRDCDALATKYKDDSFGFRWFQYGPNGDTNSLPTAIAALNPQMVEFLSPKALQQFGGGDGDNRYGTNLIVRISIFGHHTTGMHEKPWLGLDVLCGSSVTNYSPVSLHPLAPMDSWNWQYRKIADGIYEHYCIMF
jgi:hypothetical protein